MDEHRAIDDELEELAARLWAVGAGWQARREQAWESLDTREKELWRRVAAESARWAGARTEAETERRSA